MIDDTTIRCRGERSIMHGLASALIIAVAFTGPLADASVISSLRVACPVCETPFEAVAVVTEDSRGGVDRDLFARSDGPQQVYGRISTCPTCYYSGYLSDFDSDVKLPEAFVRKVRVAPKLEPPRPVPKVTDQRDIDAETRYALAAQCYAWRGRSAEAMGWLYLRWSWLVREDTAVVPPDRRLQRVLTFAKRWTQPFEAESNQSDRELRLVAHLAAALAEGEFSRYQEPFAQLAMALLLRRHGEHAQAEPLLRALRNERLLPEPLRQAAGRMADSIDHERDLQARAATHLAHALQEGQIKAPNDVVAAYLVGELHRRLDQDAEAVRWFDRALKAVSLPEDLRAWAVRQRAVAQSTQGTAGTRGEKGLQ